MSIISLVFIPYKSCCDLVNNTIPENIISGLVNNTIPEMMIQMPIKTLALINITNPLMKIKNPPMGYTP